MGHTETKRRKRAERLRKAIGNEQRMRDWCKVHGLTLTIKNLGEHWIFRHQDNIVAEWWPSSAKLVFEKRWSSGSESGTWAETTRLIEKWIGVREG